MATKTRKIKSQKQITIKKMKPTEPIKVVKIGLWKKFLNWYLSNI